MSLKLSELLNPAPSSGGRSATLHSTSQEDDAASSSIQDVETISSTQLPPPLPLQTVRLDTSPPLGPGVRHIAPVEPSTGVRHVAPVEPSTPLEHGSISPTLDQYHMSPSQHPARRRSIVEKPQIPPTLPLPPIQLQYDLLPPVNRIENRLENRLESLVEPNNPSTELMGTRPLEAQAPDTEANFSIPLRQEALTHDTTDHDQSRIMKEIPSSNSRGAEEEIAALGLAALDGVQEDEDHSAVKTEQGPQDLTTVPLSKPSSRTLKLATSKPSEGSTDKRFLCYICIKLFTRRRSVRDHIKKIHNDNHFDVARAIEVTVDPETGEPLIPLVELVKTLPAPSGDQQAQADLSRPASRASSVDTNTFSTPAPVSGKKRAAAEMAPGQSTGSKKKGTAKPKPVNTGTKKAKLEIDVSTDAVSTFRSPSGTPVSSQASKTPAALKIKKQPSISVTSSPAPSDRMSMAAATDNEAEDDGEQAYLPAREADENEADNDDDVFCICRKGDNHTWMIGCDGGCEDWFHGKCVDIQERDGDLIDKYICPSCEDKGRGQTTWKRMCRREECRKPARVLAEPPSKYCSDDCNKRFWVGMVKKSDPNALVSEDGLMVFGSKVHQRVQDRRKKKHKKAKEDSEYNDTNNDDESDDPKQGGNLSPWRKKKNISPTVTKHRKHDYAGGDATSSDDEPPLPTRGGALSVGDIKMMLNQTKTVDEIRHLGRKPPTPPYTSDADPDHHDATMVNGTGTVGEPEQKPFPYNPEERAHLQRLSASRRRLDSQLRLLRSQEQFLALIKTRSAAIIEAMDVPKSKNVCGFDARLSWSNAEFEEWSSSAAGRRALDDDGEMGDAHEPSTTGTDPIKRERATDGVLANGLDRDADAAEDGDAEDAADDDGEPSRTTVRGICARNKCPRHREWRRLLASEYKFEEDGVRRQIRKVEAEGREVRERAALRLLCERG